jgi:hypothetical protein
MSETEKKEGLEFTTDQITFSSFQLLMENNAMLRILLHNQDRIMKRLFIKQEFPLDVYDELLEIFPTVTEVPKSADHVQRICDLVRERIWRYVNLKITITDGDDRPANNR